MDVEQRRKVRNAEAHYLSIVRNIGVANRELEELFSKRARLLEEPSDIRAEIKTEQRKLEIVYQQTREVEDKADRSEQRVQKQSKEFDVRKQELLQMSREAQDLRETDIPQMKRTATQIEENITRLLGEQHNIENRIEGVNKEFKLSEIDIKQLQIFKNDLNQDITDLQRIMADFTATFEKKQKTQKLELVTLQDQIGQERARVGKPEENLKQRQVIMDRTEKDLSIYLRRMRIKYKELYPNLEFNIKR